ncbi:hypothetical protein EPIR_0624 [Erwinia piriflorinigrans CFBP 5888]|uniref:Uncharacterized protein n=1 Tax=Erwinia piriflorinigrans CFBP 5888 TaxID=1161919 RepID=V5Z4T0_9GAMM|nr:hypothetical protein EPIR_0624 [Erwinia piriflorinigrans CFBP 5888]
MHEDKIIESFDENLKHSTFRKSSEKGKWNAAGYVV